MAIRKAYSKSVIVSKTAQPGTYVCNCKALADYFSAIGDLKDEVKVLLE